MTPEHVSLWKPLYLVTVFANPFPLMHIFEQYRQHILTAVEAIVPGLKTDAVTCEPPRDAAHGDLSTNAAMVLAGQAKLKPRDIAEKLAEKLRALAAHLQSVREEEWTRISREMAHANTGHIT